MVKKLVAEAYTSEGYKEIGRALGKLKKIRLHRIQSEEAIEATCHEVMKLISGPNPTLVHLTADMLISLKSESLRQVTKAKMKGVIAPPPPIPVAMTEVQINAQEAQIGNDWNSARWKQYPPHGWAWKDQAASEGSTKNPNQEIVALVYEMNHHPDRIEIFIHRDIYTHPQGALELIKSINKRHKSLMGWKKSKKKKKNLKSVQ